MWEQGEGTDDGAFLCHTRFLAILTAHSETLGTRVPMCVLKQKNYNVVFKLQMRETITNTLRPTCAASSLRASQLALRPALRPTSLPVRRPGSSCPPAFLGRGSPQPPSQHPVAPAASPYR